MYLSFAPLLSYIWRQLLVEEVHTPKTCRCCCSLGCQADRSVTATHAVVSSRALQLPLPALQKLPLLLLPLLLLLLLLLQPLPMHLLEVLSCLAASMQRAVTAAAQLPRPCSCYCHYISSKVLSCPRASR